MNETVVDVLIYLYEHYLDGEFSDTPDQATVREELAQAGFPQAEINKAFDWLDELASHQTDAVYKAHAPHSTRIYNDAERRQLNMECRGLLLFLEQAEILDQESRELVIDRATALDAGPIDVEELKWIVLMVLINQPGQEAAFARMEDIVYNDNPVHFH